MGQSSGRDVESPAAPLHKAEQGETLSGSIDGTARIYVAALLPEKFSWLQRKIFKSHEDMTVVKLQGALKPHVKAGVLVDPQAYKHKAVG